MEVEAGAGAGAGSAGGPSCDGRLEPFEPHPPSLNSPHHLLHSSHPRTTSSVSLSRMHSGVIFKFNFLFIMFLCFNFNTRHHRKFF